MLKVFRIKGDSMLPTLKEGDYVVAFSRFWLRFLQMKIGRLVIIQHPEFGTMIKRISAVETDGIYVQGDNSLESITADDIGVIKQEQIIGLVIYDSKKK